MSDSQGQLLEGITYLFCLPLSVLGEVVLVFRNRLVDVRNTFMPIQLLETVFHYVILDLTPAVDCAKQLFISGVKVHLNDPPLCQTLLYEVVAISLSGYLPLYTMKLYVQG